MDGGTHSWLENRHLNVLKFRLVYSKCSIKGLERLAEYDSLLGLLGPPVLVAWEDGTGRRAELTIRLKTAL